MKRNGSDVENGISFFWLAAILLLVLLFAIDCNAQQWTAVQKGMGRPARLVYPPRYPVYPYPAPAYHIYVGPYGQMYYRIQYPQYPR